MCGSVSLNVYMNASVCTCAYDCVSLYVSSGMAVTPTFYRAGEANVAPVLGHSACGGGPKKWLGGC